MITFYILLNCLLAVLEPVLTALPFWFQRPNAKELLKHRFIRNARRSPRLLERIRCVQQFLLLVFVSLTRFLPVILFSNEIQT